MLTKRDRASLGRRIATGTAATAGNRTEHVGSSVCTHCTAA
jgi:hypothetical protein